VNASSVRAVVAEFLGTALFVFVGAASVVASGMTAGSSGTLTIALAHGVGMAVIISALMNISGAHFNPAVSLGAFIAGKLDGRGLGQYVGAQLVGGVVGAALVRLLFPTQAVSLAGGGTPQLAFNVDMLHAVALEAVFTFILVTVVFGTAISSEAPRIGGFGIGLAIFVAALIIGPITGAALNPARAFGPALVSMTWHSQVVYWIGPLLGGAAAGWLWKVLLLPKT
jgi:MIP family channel proteins